MNQQGLAMLRGFLQTSHHSIELMRFLPKEEVAQLERFSASETFDPKESLSLEKWAKPIHPSWFVEVLKDYPRPVLPFFLAVIPVSKKKEIQEIIADSPDLPPQGISIFLRPFLLNLLRQEIQEPDLIPEGNLSSSPLNILLKLDQKELFLLSDFLGLHDLAADIRQIVDKTLLKKITESLSPQQSQFVHYAMKQPMKWVSPKLGLSAWDGSKKRLNHLLHYRGLIRLGKAIYQEEYSFKWHLLHHFDIGRAKVIQKESYQKQDPAFNHYFKQQVLNIVRRFQS